MQTPASDARVERPSVVVEEPVEQVSPVVDPVAPTARTKGRTLLVASTGGHLGELHRLRQRIDLGDADPIWVTFDSPQSRSLLAGEDVRFVTLTAPRDLKNVVANLGPARRILRGDDITRVISTGSAVALSFFPLARSMGIDCHFIESGARRANPSVTGRLLRGVPGVQCYTQCREWSTDRWVYRGSLFDAYRPAEVVQPPTDRRIRVVVTLGTMTQSFAGPLRRLVELLGDRSRFEVRWQVGHTPTDDLDIEAVRSVTPADLNAWMADADLVIAHAGMGSTLDAMDAGRKPLLIPRREGRGEHVDDHQVEIARDLASRGLADHLELGDLTQDRVLAAVGGRVDRLAPAAIQPFELQSTARRR